jgi:lysophospholipase L1-like esterase
LLGLSTLVAALGAEFFLRLFLPQRFEVHPPGMYEIRAGVGHVPTPGFRGTLARAEYRVDFHAGSLGLRGPDPAPKSETTFRILVLGDSQAWGFGVADDETFSAVLERELARAWPETDVQVLNAAVPGYGTADELALLRARAAELRPDLVIVQFLNVNDFSDNRSPAATWARLEQGFLASKAPRPALASFGDLQRWVKRHSHLADLVFNTLGYLAMRSGWFTGVAAVSGEDFGPQDAEHTRGLLEQIADEARRHSADTLFLYTTGQAHVIGESYDPPPSAAVVASAAEASGADWIDISAALHEHEERKALYYPRDGHWTALGHEAVAHRVARHLVQAESPRTEPHR